MKNKSISIGTEDIQQLLEAGARYRSDIFSNPAGRYRSWEHCYLAFSAHKGQWNKDTLDLLTLHLTSYLASWGMYRGSSFLLKEKDYFVHRPVVELLLDSSWEDLWHPSAETIIQEKNAVRIEQLGKEISKIYCQIAKRDNDISDTLMTKILLGTLGCSPAYDGNFKKAARSLHCGVGEFSAAALIAWANFYIAYKNSFEPLRISCCQNGLEYPPMKVLDMCFFSMGERI